MNNPSKLILRAHIEGAPKRPKSNRKLKEKQPPKWSNSILVFDCETRIDEKQGLTFGSYRVCCCDEHGCYSDVREEGLFYAPDEVTSRESGALQRYVKRHRAETSTNVPSQILIRTREQFLKEVFLPLALNGAMVVCFNMPFDISRLAADATRARRLNEDWSFILLEEPLRPRIVVTRKDGKMAFFRFSGILGRSRKHGKKKVVPRGRFLDVRTLAWALRNVSYSLGSLCAELKIPGKLADHKPTGTISEEEIEYVRQDVRATVAALNVLRADFDRFPINLPPDLAYSPASIVKAYFQKMGIIPPLQKFHLSPNIQGIAAQSFYGGRAECRIRRTPVPVVHTDFKSQYPTIITLMGLSRLVVAKKLRITKATRDVRALLKRVTLGETFDPGFWPSFTCFALVQPDKDILPVRTAYDADSGENNVGVNFLTSARPIWYALPDLIASKLLTGKFPKIIKALRVVGEGWQPGLQPTTLGESEIDPRTGDFFKTVIEVRERIKRDTRLPLSDREALGYFLKTMANAGYGIFIETTPKKVPGRKPLTVFSGEFKFPTTSAVAEEKGAWYCPLIASLVTSGGRLFLAMLECAVKDLGGSYLFADTDSMAIVSTKLGGLVACGGGLSRMPNGWEAVNSLSWKEVTQIADLFNLLNPYDRGAVPRVLKIEDVNYENGVQRQLEGYAISSKRYTFFTRTARNVRIITPSEHGLGHLFIPNSKFDKKQGARAWVVEVWKYLIQTSLRQRTSQPNCFLLPAMMKLAVTTPDVLKVLQQRELTKGTTYRERLKPFNFIQSPMINRQVYAVGSNAKRIARLGFPSTADADHFTLISPFTEDSTRWYKISYINVHDGRQFYLAPLEEKQSFEASPYTIEDIVGLYHIHPESKSLAPDGGQCDWHTAGLLQRNSVVTDGFGYIGKETDRKWEQEEDLSILFPTLPVYQPNESARLLGGFGVQNKIRTMSKREMARRTGLSTRTISAIRKGKRIRKSTALIVTRALRNRDIERAGGQEITRQSHRN